MKTILIMTLIVVLPVFLWGYTSYNRVPVDTDKASFIYSCSDYTANNTSIDNKVTAKKVCSCLWYDMTGKYKFIGKINSYTLDGDKFGLYSEEVLKMANACASEVSYDD